MSFVISALATWPEKKIADEMRLYDTSTASVYKTRNPAIHSRWTKFNGEQSHMQLFDYEVVSEAGIDDQKQYTSEGKPNIFAHSTNPYPSLYLKPHSGM